MVTTTKMLPGIFSALNRSSTSGPAAKSVRHWRVSWITLWMWVVRVFSLALKLTKNRYFLVTSEAAGVSRRVFSRVSCFSSPVHFANGETRYMSSEPKRLCTENMTVTKIGTHNGTFHCDEVLACFFLRQLPEYSYIWTFSDTFNSLCPEKPWLTKLSSAGLVYLHFGRRVLSQLAQLKEDDRQLEVLYDKLYENFVEEVDAVDNGISQCDGEARYSISTTLSARVSHLNPRWNSTDQDTEEGFKKALKMVGEEFLDRLDFYKSSWLPAREVVEEAVKKRHQIDPSGEVLLFSQGGCPWKEHLFALEKDLHVETPIKFVLYPDQNGQWRVQCVPAGLNTFQNR
ncbi:UPF0160 protein MYG1, mitochondrial [Neolamprologus brichardi]|uniref:UPF0160 protein MYG1, mitochondrial n=1 Tax=Neolamprologus brichardi TaxID=32507 RepID=UPI0003EC587C|nr:UPF0160 protein MYG1, mitochondrial [Neolamprologus brichardi]